MHLDPLIAELHKDQPELLNDVLAWKSALGQDAGIKSYQLYDSDEPCDLLLMGTEVLGSCQRIGGNPHLNKGLLGTMLDGKNRLLALKKPNGEIAGRALIRLMSNNGKPALLIERIYPQTLGEAESAALIDFAKKRAQELGLELYTAELKGMPTKVTLTSGKSRGAFQYVDSAGGNKENGIFAVQNVRLMQGVAND